MSAVTDCPKRCGCRNNKFVESEALSPRFRKEHTDESGGLGGKVEAGGWN